MKRIVLIVCILSGLAALAPPPAAGQGVGDFGSGYGTKFIYRKPYRYDLDTTLLDSLIQAKAPGGSGGRTYVSLNPFGYMNALQILDSTDQNYMLYVPYAIQWVQGYRNFANGANDSALVQNVAGSYSILPPSILGEWITFVNVTVRTTYGTAVAQEIFPFAMTQASADTAIYSAALVCRTISSVRHYYVRIYKHYTSSFSGINPPLTGGTLVTSVEVTNALFPNAATSTYALISIGYRRIQ